MDKRIKLPTSIKLYLSKKLRKAPTLNLNNPINPSRLRSACKYPKTPSFDERNSDKTKNHTINHAATLSDVDRFLFENFYSLYVNDNDSSSLKHHASMHADFSGNTASSSSMTSSSSRTDEISERELSGGIVTFSIDPYEDFRTSMKRMLEAHHADASQPLDWDFMELLLLCYLEVNSKSMHKHVLQAFSDITSGFHQSRVSVVSRRTVPVPASSRRKKAVDREEIPHSPSQHLRADFTEDCGTKQIE